MQFVWTELESCWNEIWFWYATENQCTTHNCNALSLAQACIGNKNFHSKTGRNIKNCGGICELCANNAMKHRIFKELCNGISSVFEVLLYYSNVWWLSRVKMLNHVFTLRVELAMLLREHQHRHADCFENSEFILVLAYMVDIFDALNNLNQQMQGNDEWGMIT